MTYINGNQTDANEGTPAVLENEGRALRDTSSHFPKESGLLFPQVPALSDAVSLHILLSRGTLSPFVWVGGRKGGTSSVS